MAKQCYWCKFNDVDYEWDDDVGDERPIYSCQKDRPEFSDDNADCDAFKKYRPRKRREQSSKCDGCASVDVCGCIESTEIGDTIRHYIAPAGAVCTRDKK